MSYRKTKCPMSIVTEPAGCEGAECQWFIANRGRCAIAVIGDIMAEDVARKAARKERAAELAQKQQERAADLMARAKSLSEELSNDVH